MSQSLHYAVATAFSPAHHALASRRLLTTPQTAAFRKLVRMARASAVGVLSMLFLVYCCVEVAGRNIPSHDQLEGEHSKELLETWSSCLAYGGQNLVKPATCVLRVYMTAYLHSGTGTLLRPSQGRILKQAIG